MKTLSLVLIAVFLTGCIGTNQSNQFLFEGNPKDLLLIEDDLPGQYSLMENLSGAKLNEDLVMNTDNPNAKNLYLEKTGRLEGWEHHYMLMEPTQTLPGFILNQVIVYKTSEGAQEALFWPVTQSRQIIETEEKIGDAMAFTMMHFMAPDESPWIEYQVEFTYKNLLGVVSTYAPEQIATADFALDLAEQLYQSFKIAMSE